jgi:gamma-glutamylcyclotransferase (GGCT)/AIG2-like uncharacterized protein YtfP
MKLFVYGSLLRGMSLSKHMQGSTFLGPAYAMADLFFLGFYPGIIPGNQVVYGELYDVPLNLLPEIDKVEDYIQIDTESSLYLRRPIEVYRFSDGKKIEASAYYYNRDAKDKPRIAYGDYRKFMHSQKSDKAWLIGYGTNLSSHALYSKIGEVPEHKIIQVEGFNPVFNVRTGINGFARANLSFTGSKKRLNLVAWNLTPEQFERMDIEEQVPLLYHRVSMPYISSEGEFHYAQTYMANTERISNNLHPEPHYIDIQEHGMREHGIR